jgi:hypothetical protein
LARIVRTCNSGTLLTHFNLDNSIRARAQALSVGMESMTEQEKRIDSVGNANDRKRVIRKDDKLILPKLHADTSTNPKTSKHRQLLLIWFDLI